MKKHYILLLAVAAVLSSCSRYGLTTVRNNVNPQASVKKTQEQEVQTTQTFAVQEIPAAADDVDAAEDNTNTPSVKTPAAPASKKILTKSEVKAVVTQLTKDLKRSPEKINTVSEKKIAKAGQEKQIEKGSWLYFIVVGLILLIIAALVSSTLSGVLGYLIWLVGAILIIYGLLKLLLG